MKRILAAIDTSEASSFVLARAVELARTFGGKLRLVRAVPPPPVVPAPLVVPGSSYGIVAMLGHAEESMRARVLEVPAELRDGFVVEAGSAAHVIREAANAYRADVVVLGAHDHGIVARALGTTAAKIVDHADCTVMVVRETPRALVQETEAVARDSSGAPARAHDEHVLLETATLAGAASGAALGALAGPPGVVIGGVIGAAAGMLAGRTLDDEDARASAHDRVLDRDIGLTDGNVGEHDRASAAFTRIERAARSGAEVALDGEPLRAGAFLRRDHERLEQLYEAFLEAYRSGDWEKVRAQWDVLEPSMEIHMSTEEHDVLPLFHEVDPQEADDLLADHEELRRLLGTIGVAIELHAVPLDDAQELIGRLRAHAAREEILLYPWMDVALEPRALGRLSAA